jgi:uncharacterized protein YwqG
MNRCSYKKIVPLKRRNLIIALVLTSLFHLNATSQLYPFGFPEKVKDKGTFTKRIMELPWKEPKKIESLIEPSIIPLADSTLPVLIGQSKFGGMPDLPEHLAWPAFNNRPMVFLSQINLKEIANIYKDSLLPQQGILYFFCHFEEPTNVFGAAYTFRKIKEEYKVLYFDGNEQTLQARAFPPDLFSGYRFKDMPIRYELIHYFPTTTEKYRFEKAGLQVDDENLFNDIANMYFPDMILGTPSPLQYGADYDWAYTAMNVEMKDYDDPLLPQKAKQITPDFINLLSFTLVEKFKKIGNDNCYFGIRKKDLLAKKFDETIFIMQGD